MTTRLGSGRGTVPNESLYTRLLRRLVLGLGILSGISVLAMIVVTCLDVILRLPFIGRSLVGAYDITKIAGALSLAAALPYTTACKGHVAIDYFSQKLNRRGRRILDALIHLTGMALFAFLAWRAMLYGAEMYRSGQVSQTLQWPVFWLPWAIGFCCAVVVTMMGVISPPVGVCVYVVGGIEREVPLATIFRGSLPFLAALVVVAIILMTFRSSVGSEGILVRVGAGQGLWP